MGIEENANEQEIKKAYKKQAIVWHPDKHSNGTEEERKKAESMFKEIGEAHDVLSNP